MTGTLDKTEGMGRSAFLGLTRLQEAYLHLTNRCFGGCPHCYASTSPQDASHELTTDQWQELIGQLRRLGTQRFVFLGGDPFLRDDLFTLAKTVLESGARNLRIFYNGHISPETAMALAQLSPDGRLIMVVSLEGPDPATNDIIRGRGNFERMVAGMRHVLARLPLVVNTVVSSVNQKQLVPLARFLVELGVPRQHLIFLHFRGRLARHPELWPDLSTLADDLLSLKMEAERLGLLVDNFAAWQSRVGGNYDFCNAGYTLLTIAQDGTAYACPATVGDPALAAGNVTEKGVEEVWLLSPVLGRWRDWTHRRRASCQSCVVRAYCGGDCPLHAYTYTQATIGEADFDANNPYCPMLQRVFQVLMDGATIPATDAPLTYLECT